jgi:hypothetical protein
MSNSTIRGALLAMVAVTGLSACGGSQPDPGVSPDAPTLVRVENRTSDDMTIYVLRSGQRLRLGTVNVGQTQTFKLAKTIVVGMTTLRFIADPIGGRINSISEEISLNPGEEIVLRLGPL